MDWRDLERMVKEERKAGNPVASTIHSLQVRGLGSRLALALAHPPPTSVRSHPHQPHTHEYAASYARWALRRVGGRAAAGCSPTGRTGQPFTGGCGTVQGVPAGVARARWHSPYLRARTHA